MLLHCKNIHLHIISTQHPILTTVTTLLLIIFSGLLFTTTQHLMMATLLLIIFNGLLFTATVLLIIFSGLLFTANQHQGSLLLTTFNQLLTTTTQHLMAIHPYELHRNFTLHLLITNQVTMRMMCIILQFDFTPANFLHT